VIYDTDSNGFGGPGDMNGPGIGEVAYRQAPDSSLQLDVRLEFAQLVTTYEAFLVCGAAHSLACGFVSAGTVTTDAVGAGSGTLTVPAGVLLAAPFGPGYRSDHLDLLQGAGDVSRGLLTAGALTTSCVDGGRSRAQPNASRSRRKQRGRRVRQGNVIPQAR
jgi:hypothetical protein